MILRTTQTIAALSLLLMPGLAPAQAAKPDGAKKPEKTPDTLVFANGEQLTGELETATADGITFKSAMAGEIKVPWKNVKELRSDKQFALLTKGEKLKRKNAQAVVPEGKVSVADKQLTVATATGPKVVPVADADLLVDARGVRQGGEPSAGAAAGLGRDGAGGVSLVRSTQNSTTFNGGINLVRASPGVSWLPARSKTILDYNQSYGTVSQPNTVPATPTIETNVFHADAERDEYFTPRAFVFASATFDHNFSRSWTCSRRMAGSGLTLLKNSHRELDLKADAHYEKQVFFNSALNPRSWLRRRTRTCSGLLFRRSICASCAMGWCFNEFGSISPSWYQSNMSATQPNAYSAHINASLGFPVFKGHWLQRGRGGRLPEQCAGGVEAQHRASSPPT